jgi:hypothetical protein
MIFQVYMVPRANAASCVPIDRALYVQNVQR